MFNLDLDGEEPSVETVNTSQQQMDSAAAVAPMFNQLFNYGAGNAAGAAMGGTDLNMRSANMGQNFQMGQIAPLMNQMMQSFGGSLGAYGGQAFHGGARQAGMQNIISQMLPGMLGRSMGFSQINPGTIGQQAQNFAQTPLQFGQNSIENVVNPGSTGLLTPILTGMGGSIGSDWMGEITGGGSGGGGWWDSGNNNSGGGY